MRVITCNLNGIRAAEKKGFFHWINQQDPDLLCLQETKAQLANLKIYLEHYYCHENCALKPGYSGVAIYTKQPPVMIRREFSIDNDWFNQEGRFIQLDYENFSIISIYFPSGTSGEHRQAKKYDYMIRCEAYFAEIINQKKSCIICGDVNIAHKLIDLKNWQANQKHSGFLPQERVWLDKLFEHYGFVDAFRVKNHLPDQYTWWSNRGRAYEKNVGWRIDYQIVTPDWKNKIQSVFIYKDQRFSDHAPVVIDYD